MIQFLLYFSLNDSENNSLDFLDGPQQTIVRLKVSLT